MVPELEVHLKSWAPRWRYWTEYDDAVLRRYYRKVPPSELSKTLNRSKAGIDHRARKLGLSHEVRRPLDRLPDG